jgi:hypothetical protein
MKIPTFNNPDLAPALDSGELTGLPDDFDLDLVLRLASDNPEPDASQRPAETVSASIRMASYRLAAVFGELRWVDGDAA